MPPRKRRTTADIELANLPPVPEGFSTLSPTDERRERELEDILSELGTDARIKVWQIIDGKSSYAGDMSADGFTLDALLDAFGGGDKSLVIMQGKTRVEKVSISLDPSIPPKNPRAPKLAPGAVVPGNDMNSLIMIMAKNQMDSAQAMSTMMTGMVGALVTVMGASRPTADPIAQAIQIANVLKPANNAGPGSLVEAMTLLREGIKLGEQMGGKDDDDGVMSVVGKGMDTLAVLVNGIVEERKTKAAEAARSLPASTGRSGEAGGEVGGTGSVAGSGDVGRADAGGGPQAEPPVSVRPWVDTVRPHIGQLLAASSFLPAKTAADVIASKLTDDQFFDLVDDIQDQENGGFGVRLKEYFPDDIDKVNPEWLGEVLRILLTDYVEPDDADVAAAGTPESN